MTKLLGAGPAPWSTLACRERLATAVNDDHRGAHRGGTIAGWPPAWML